MDSLAKIQAELRGMGATTSAASIGLVVALAILPDSVEVAENIVFGDGRELHGGSAILHALYVLENGEQ